MKDVKQLKEQMRAIIYDTPQSDILEHHHVENWIERVIEIDPDRAIWHCRRLHGSGGSDSGSLMNSLKGRNNAFSSAQDICAHKLCILPPSKGDKHTKRGSVLESMVREVFEREMAEKGFRVERLTGVREEIEQKENEVYPWLRSSMDELYRVDRIEDPAQSEIWLVDFKCPSPDMIAGYRRNALKHTDPNHEGANKELSNDVDYLYIPAREDRNDARESTEEMEFDDYIAQLHHYSEDAKIKGAHIDRMVLVGFDYMRASCLMFDIQEDPAVTQELIEANEYYWNEFILKGDLPPSDSRAQIDADEIDPEFKKMADKYLRLKHMASVAQKAADGLKDEIARKLSLEGDFGETRVNMTGAVAKGVLKFDEEYVLQRLSELGISEEETDKLRVAGKYSEAKLRKHWHEITGATNDLLGAVQAGDKNIVKNSLGKLSALMATVPQTAKGALDQAKVSEKMSQLGENPEKFFREEVQVAEYRGKCPELAVLKSQMKETITPLIEAIKQGVSIELDLEDPEQDSEVKPNF